MRRKRAKWPSLLAFTAPALLLYIVFELVPSVNGFWFSLTDWNGLAKGYKFIGAANYLEALREDSYFLNSIAFTLRFVLAMVLLENVAALALAVLVESRERSKDLFRLLLFLPNMVSMIVGGFMWMFIFTRVLPQAAQATGLSFLDRSWIGDPHWSFWAIVAVSLWGGTGYLMIIYIAALQGVPRVLRDAAAIDGAGAFREFFSVVLPSILPALTICVFLTLNSSFKVYEAVYALTGGGPGRATQAVALNIFEEAFNMNNRYGYANAKAAILFAIVLAVTLAQLALMKRRELEA
jgi:raffinose/stachyose/melibiose transport system permease protein